MRGLLAPNRALAESYLEQITAKYSQKASKLAEWMEENIHEGLSVFDFPEQHRIRLRTTNSLDRLSQEIKRRTRVARIFPNEASCLRLVSAILMEISEEWETGKVYLAFDTS